MKYKNILYEFFPDEAIFFSNKKRLIVLLGSFADFDSFEYAQQIAAQSENLSNHSVEYIIIGIGSEKSKEYFCRFNKIDVKKVLAVPNVVLHKKLNLNTGLVTPFPSIINLIIMCSGINSKGTIKEVLRGYWGDKNSKPIFSSNDDLNIGPFTSINGKMFEIFSKESKLRPFELATRRLINMIEILSNWNIYVPDASFLTQRGATIFLNEKDDVLYTFYSESLLGYAPDMSAPLSFLDNFLN